MSIPPHGECADLLAEQMAAMGVEVTVETEPNGTEPLICPHGFMFWLVPTPAQVARWSVEDLP